MIIDFSIENFGSFKARETISFEATSNSDLEDYYVITPDKNKKIRLLRLVMLYGANASGKTTILDALEFLRDLVLDPTHKKTSHLKFNPFLFDPDTPNFDSKLGLRFIQNGIKYAYEINFNQQAITFESLHFFNPNKSLLFKRTSNQITQVTDGIKCGDKTNLSHVDIEVLTKNTLWNNSVLAGFNQSNIESEPLKFAFEWFNDVLMPMVSSKTRLSGFIGELIELNKIDKTNILQRLQQADFNIAEFDFIKKKHSNYEFNIIEELKEMANIPNELIEDIHNQKDLYFKYIVNNKIYELPFHEESSGTQRYFEMAGLVALLENKEKILSIDEFELSLHSDLIKYFLLTYLKKSTHSQILLTTHYREFLDERDLFRDDAIWFTEKNKESATEIFCLADFKTDTLRKTSSVYNAYKLGKLGAVPNTAN